MESFRPCCDCPIVKSKKPVQPLAERFWKHVDKSGDCWVWTGSRQDYGHGILTLHRGHTMQAHRVAWMLHHGVRVPDGKHILHKCDNPPCVNPSHLYCGTHDDNMRDKAVRGRASSLRGEKNPVAKITGSIVEKARQMYTGRYGDVARISRELQAPYHAIWSVVHGETWR